MKEHVDCCGKMSPFVHYYVINIYSTLEQVFDNIIIVKHSNHMYRKSDHVKFNHTYETMDSCLFIEGICVNIYCSLFS